MIGGPGQRIIMVHHGFAGILHPGEIDGLEAAAFRHRDAAVEQEVVVEHPVHASMLIQEIHVPGQALAVAERVAEGVHDLSFIGAQGVRIGRVQGREGNIFDRISNAAQTDLMPYQVQLVQQQPVLHMIFRVAEDDLPFQLEHHHVDGLELRLAQRKARVCLFGKKGQRPQGNAVAALQHVQVVVIQAVAHDGGDARLVPAGGAHPEDVVVAPLDVHGVVAQKHVQYPVRVRAAVKNIADDVQPVHRQPLDQHAQRFDELVRAAQLDQGFQNLLVVDELVVVLVRLGVQQLVQHIGVLGRHGLAHLAARVAGGQGTAQPDQPVQVFFIEGRRHVAQLQLHGELFLRVVDQGEEIIPLLLGHLPGELLLRFFADDPGAVVQNVAEGLVLAVQVGHKMLRPLRQVEDGLQVDDLGIQGLVVRKPFGQQVQDFVRGSVFHTVLPTWVKALKETQFPQ